MRRAFVILLPLLYLGPATAQPPPATPPAAGAAEKPLQLVENARVLYVARTLRLRQDQVPKIVVLLNQAQERIGQRDDALDALWVKGQATFAASDGAIIAGRQPTQAATNAAQRLVAAHDDARDKAAADLERLLGQMLGLLDKTQLERVETPRQHQVQAQNAQRYQGAADIARYMARYVSAMRQLEADEYDTLRVPMALRLAGRLMAPDQAGYNNAVGDVLRIMDTVRRLSDAEFAQREAQLPASIAQALRLPQEALAETRPVSYDDILAFMTSAMTVTLLQTFQADPAMEVVP